MDPGGVHPRGWAMRSYQSPSTPGTLRHDVRGRHSVRKCYSSGSAPDLRGCGGNPGARVLQVDGPDDFVIATRTSYMMRVFPQIAFEHAVGGEIAQLRRALPAARGSRQPDRRRVEGGRGLGLEATDADVGVPSGQPGRRSGASRMRIALFTGDSFGATQIACVLDAGSPAVTLGRVVEALQRPAELVAPH